MQRRSILSALGTGMLALSGCSGSLGTLGTRTAGSRRATVALDPIPDSLHAAVDVSVVSDARDAPLVLVIAVTNDTATTQTYRFGGAAPWSALDSQTGPDGVSGVLAPGGRASRYAPDADARRCARATAPVRVSGESTIRDLSPGSTLSGRYALLAANDADDCLHLGTYRWRASTYLGNADWGFDVTLRE